VKKLEIAKGRGRLYFDPETGFIRMDYNGSGPTMGLTKDELISLSRSAWYAAQQRPPSSARD
jgi:hypothetical protein